MLSSAPIVTPDAIDVSESAKPKDLQVETPIPLPGISAERVMPATVAAGVSLAKFVLWIAAFSIISLVLYLITMEIIVASNVKDSYSKVYALGPVGPEFKTIQQIDRISKELIKSKDDAAFQMSADAIKEGLEISEIVDQVPSLSLNDKSKLRFCLPATPDESRNKIISQCLSLLLDLRGGLVEQASSLSRSQSASDAANKINEHRQTLHLFWIQAAQLILLNLLLPLLTALFGYVFGTQQGNRSS